MLLIRTFYNLHWLEMDHSWTLRISHLNLAILLHCQTSSTKKKCFYASHKSKQIVWSVLGSDTHALTDRFYFVFLSLLSRMTYYATLGITFHHPYYLSLLFYATSSSLYPKLQNNNSWLISKLLGKNAINRKCMTFVAYSELVILLTVSQGWLRTKVLKFSW